MPEVIRRCSNTYLDGQEGDSESSEIRLDLVDTDFIKKQLNAQHHLAPHDPIPFPHAAPLTPSDPKKYDVAAPQPP